MHIFIIFRPHPRSRAMTTYRIVLIRKQKKTIPLLLLLLQLLLLLIPASTTNKTNKWKTVCIDKSASMYRQKCQLLEKESAHYPRTGIQCRHKEKLYQMLHLGKSRACSQMILGDVESEESQTHNLLLATLRPRLPRGPIAATIRITYCQQNRRDVFFKKKRLRIQESAVH